MSGVRKAIDWSKYPLRQCRWLNECLVCGEKITSGQMYLDGGYGRRAHDDCAEKDRAGGDA